MARSKKPASDQIAAPTAVQLTTESLKARALALASSVMDKLQARIHNPGYQPSPSDVVAAIRACADLDELVFRLPSLKLRLDEIKQEVKAVETTLLNLLTLSSDKPAR